MKAFVSLVIGGIIGFGCFFATTLLISIDRWGLESNRIREIAESETKDVEWSTSRAESPDGNWIAKRDSHSTIIIEPEGSTRNEAELDHNDSDLSFVQLGWVDDETLVVEGIYTTGDTHWYEWKWRWWRIGPDGIGFELYALWITSTLVLSGLIYVVLRLASVPNPSQIREADSH